LKVYLAGPITGILNYFDIFAKAAQQLRLDGHEVYNPAAANLDGLPINQIMGHELNWLCFEAEAIALLPGWENSRGTAIEIALAEYLGKKIIKL